MEASSKGAGVSGPDRRRMRHAFHTVPLRRGPLFHLGVYLDGDNLHRGIGEQENASSPSTFERASFPRRVDSLAGSAFQHGISARGSYAAKTPQVRLGRPPHDRSTKLNQRVVTIILVDGVPTGNIQPG